MPMADAFLRAYNSTVEIGLKQEDAAAKRAVATREANMAAQIRAVLTQQQIHEPGGMIQPPNTDLGSVGEPNALPLDGSAPPGGMAGELAGMGGMTIGQKPPTPFGESKRPGLSDMAAQMRDLGKVMILGGDYKTGRQFLSDAVLAEKRAAEIDTQELEQQAEMADFIGSIAGSVKDQQSFTNAIMIASMHGFAEEAAGLYEMTGGQYGPEAQAVLEQFATSSMSVKEQSQMAISQANLANNNRRTESMIDARNSSMAKDKEAIAISRERLGMAKTREQANLANNNRRTESMIDARKAAADSSRSSTSIARERLRLAKEKHAERGETPDKTEKKTAFQKTMEAAGIAPGTTEYVKAARIKAKLERGAGSSSTANVISELLAEPPPRPTSKVTVLEEPEPKPKPEKKVTTTPKAEAPPAAVQYLKEHPELKAEFKKKYGYLPDGV